jgi:hypothetical protein
VGIVKEYHYTEFVLHALISSFELGNPANVKIDLVKL